MRAMSAQRHASPQVMASPVHSAAPSTEPSPPTGSGYDPVALAESLASAAEKSAKLMGDFASRQAEAGVIL